MSIIDNTSIDFSKQCELISVIFNVLCSSTRLKSANLVERLSSRFFLDLAKLVLALLASTVLWQFWRQRFYFDSSHRKYSARFILFSCGRYFLRLGVSAPSPIAHRCQISYSSSESSSLYGMRRLNTVVLLGGCSFMQWLRLSFMTCVNENGVSVFRKSWKNELYPKLEISFRLWRRKSVQSSTTIRASHI